MPSSCPIRVPGHRPADCMAMSTLRISERLELRPVPWAAVEAIVAGDRLPGWADDFPDVGDQIIARLLHQGGPAVAESERTSPWGHYQVLERASGAVVGGAGFKGPPEDGETEIGYNIVPSRQRRGYATEAARTLLAIAWAHPEARSVTASTDLGNVASQRVLEKAGFALAATTDEKHYRVHRPLASPIARLFRTKTELRTNSTTARSAAEARNLRLPQGRWLLLREFRQGSRL
jgi:[ribosomal protein S5]-alanine N-acetyltransferase